MPTFKHVAIALVALAVWIDLGKYHASHNGDTIVPVLTSLYEWTLFYWEDDRFGMVLPLLAAPVSHPLWNLLVQSGLAILSGVASFFALARCVSREAWVPLGAVAALLYLGGYGAEGGGLFIVGQTYGTALFLTGAGLSLLLPADRPSRLRFAGGVLLVFAAHWSAVTAAFLLVPILIGRWLFELDGTARTPAAVAAAPRPTRQERRRAARMKHRDGEAPPPSRLGRLAGTCGGFLISPTGSRLAIVGAAFLASYAATKSSPYHIPGRYGPLPAGEWVENWVGLARNGWHEVPSTLAVGVPVIAAFGLVAGLLRRDWKALRTGGLTAATLAGGGLLSFALTGIVTWTKLQERPARYAIPALVTIQLALLAMGLIPILASLADRGRRAVAWTSLAALLCTGAIKAGPPSLRRVREDLDRTIGVRTAEVLENGVTHMVGSYWSVWPTLFHANLVLHEAGSDRKIWGITHRCAPTADRWARIPLERWHIAIAHGDLQDPWARTCMKMYRVPDLVEYARLKTVSLYRPAAVVQKK